MRLDELVLDRKLASSIEEARRLIMAGRVFSEKDHRLDKPGQPVEETLILRLREPGGLRGSEKLRGALDHWEIEVGGWICADIGAGAGGFTKLLLERGAAKVYAIDVGRGQIAASLRGDPRVVVMERVNARYLEKLPEPVALFTVDVSFISLDKILPALRKVIEHQGKGAEIIALVKPQFELGKKIADRFKGVIRDPALQQEAVEQVKNRAEGLGFRVQGEVPAPIKGPKGNQEYFLYLKHESRIRNKE